MQHDIKVYLYDIISSIDSIFQYISGFSFEKYYEHRQVKRAVEREFEIIGEAINNILKLDGSIEITEARKIVDFRNQLSHGYSSVSDKVVWSIIETKLPILREEISKLMNQ